MNSFRTETTDGSESRTLEETSRSRDATVTASGKLVAAVFEEHSLVSGMEFESNCRADTRTSLQNGAPILTDFGGNISASSLRLAAYAQDEWSFSEHWRRTPGCAGKASVRAARSRKASPRRATSAAS